VAGNEIGVFCWTLAAGAELTALLRANAVLFAGVHIAGTYPVESRLTWANDSAE